MSEDLSTDRSLGKSYGPYRKMLEGHGYPTNIHSGVYEAGDFRLRGGHMVGDDVFEALALHLARGGEPFSGWSQDLAVKGHGNRYAFWWEVYGA